MNIYAVNKERDYAIDGASMAGLVAVMQRLYDDSKPLAVNEKRDLAQRLHALLENAEEM